MVGASENGRKVMRRKREGEGFSRGWGNPSLGMAMTAEDCRRGETSQRRIRIRKNGTQGGREADAKVLFPASHQPPPEEF